MNSVFGRRANIDVDDDGVDAGAMWSRHYHNNVLLSHLTAANFHKNSHPNVSHYFNPTPLHTMHGYPEYQLKRSIILKPSFHDRMMQAFLSKSPPPCRHPCPPPCLPPCRPPRPTSWPTCQPPWPP